MEDAERYEEMYVKVEELYRLQQAIALKSLLDGRMQNFDKSELLTPEQARAKVLKKIRKYTIVDGRRDISTVIKERLEQ